MCRLTCHYIRDHIPGHRILFVEQIILTFVQPQNLDSKMLQANFGVVFTVAVWFPFALTQTCTQLTSIGEQINTCFNSFYYNLSDEPEKLNNWCKTVDCGASCMERAISPCPQLANGLLIQKLSSTKTKYRAICGNQIDYIGSRQNCATNEACQKAWSESVHNIDRENYDAEFCKFANTLVACLIANPIKSSGNCTPAMANFATNHLIVVFSLTECGNKQTHPYFTQYGGPLNCPTDDAEGGSPSTGAGFHAMVGRSGQLLWYFSQVLFCITINFRRV
ncbi:hypothetical protein DPMN_131113 [Dreissena polymorpha]|uniref:Uncharacterized protein n=1 Tax=Dreissena polymorpha TaxID=45954 RepID=A0A9D4H7U3_DREPO|nr:hypothetical protein DPMN_131113 [Dreissena polymorpha]